LFSIYLFLSATAELHFSFASVTSTRAW